MKFFPNLSPLQNIGSPENKVKAEFQVLLLSISKTGRYLNINSIKKRSFIEIIKQNGGDFGIEKDLFTYKIDILFVL